MAIIEAKKRAPVAAASVLDNPALAELLKEFNMADENGQVRQVNIAADGLGVGPLLDPAVIERFGQLDTTRELTVLGWMLDKAGGGAKAREDSAEKLEMCKSLFIAERMEGLGERGTKVEPMNRVQAEAAWLAEEPTFRNAFLPGDQDMLAQNNGTIFGFDRYWPGRNSIYERVFKAVKTFIDHMSGRVGNQSKVSIINQTRSQRAEEEGARFVPVEMDLTKYQTLEALEQVNDEITYFFKRRAASKDIQFIGRHPEKPEYTRGSDVKFYEDDTVSAYVPATAAAMMKVGFDNWCVANRSEFERAFHRTGRATPNWTGYTQRGPFMVIHAKVEVPEPTYQLGHEYHQSMRRIAVYMPLDLCDLPNLAEPYPGVQFFDRINRNSPRPVDYEELLGRVAQTPHGERLAASIRAAMAAFVTWAKQMKDNEIKSSVYERLAAVLVYDLLYS